MSEKRPIFAPYTPIPAYMADPRMAWARFADGDGAGGVNGEGEGGQQSGDPAQEPDWKAEAEKIKAEARKWEARAKENKAAAEKLAEIEEANKTAEQKTAERLAAAEKKAAEAEAKALRAEVANSKGVPAGLLSGSTLEELEAAADALIEFRDKSKPGAPVVRGQEKSPANIPASEEREAARKLFGKN
jgi:hypothetical protein